MKHVSHIVNFSRLILTLHMYNIIVKWRTKERIYTYNDDILLL